MLESLNLHITRFLTQRGWRQSLMMMVCGGLLTLGFAPYYLLFCAIFSIAALVTALNHAETKWHAFRLGWWFGFAHHVTALWWISNSLLVEAERFAWMIPLAVSAIPAALATYIALIGLCYHTLRQRYPTIRNSAWQSTRIFALLWVGIEMIRAYLFTGFPWNLVGYVWAETPAIRQFASLLGIYGLSLLLILPAAALGMMLHRRGMFLTPSHRWQPLMASTALLLICTFFGMWRQPEIAQTTTQQVLILQPNIPQQHIVDARYDASHFMTHLTQTKEHAQPGDLILWPESSIPYPPEQTPEVSRMIASALPDQAQLIAGGLRVVHASDGDMHYFNSLFHFRYDGKILQAYDKHHLVPFGEYVPLRRFLPFIEKITAGAQDFSRGKGLQSLPLHHPDLNGKSLYFSPLICYEAIFPGHVKTNAPAIPNMLINLTNDGWFGRTHGPHQHLAMAQIRAVEEGIPLLRSANTGISAVIDSYGNISNATTLGESAILRAILPEALPDSPMLLFRHYGILAPLAVLAAFLCAILWSIYSGRKAGRQTKDMIEF